MRRLNHKNIVMYLGGEEALDVGKLYIFTELAAGGSIEGMLKQYGPFKEVLIALASICVNFS